MRLLRTIAIGTGSSSTIKTLSLWKNSAAFPLQKKIPKKNIIPCKSCSHPEKPPIMKKPQPLHLKNSQSLQKLLTPSEKFSTPLK